MVPLSYMVISVIVGETGYDNDLINGVFMLLLYFKDVTSISPISDVNSRKTETDSNSRVNAPTYSDV